MAYLVLARKWRPRGFDAITGQEHVTRTLKNAILQNRVHHAFLFCGARGVGKTSAARVLARALNCQRSEGPTIDPCGECSACVEIAANKQLLNDLLHALVPGARYRPEPGTYLAWVDCTELGLSNPARHFEQAGRVAFSPGANFSPAHGQYVRVNLATSPAIITQAVERIASSLRHPV